MDEKNFSVKILRISQIRRDALERIYDEPWADRFVQGLFTKLSAGERNGIQMYRICEIYAIKNYHRKYNFGIHITKKSLKINLNKRNETFRMILVSNKQFEIKEFKTWCKIVKYTNTITPSCEELQDLVVKRHYYRKKFIYTRKNIQKIQKQKLVEKLKDLSKIKKLFVVKSQIQIDKQKADYKKDMKQSKFLQNLLLKIEKEERMRDYFQKKSQNITKKVKHYYKREMQIQKHFFINHINEKGNVKVVSSEKNSLEISFNNITKSLERKSTIALNRLFLTEIFLLKSKPFIKRPVKLLWPKVLK